MKSLLPLIFLFSIWSMVVFSQPAMAVTGNEYIWTEEPQYLKGDTAYIFGIGFTPYTPVLIKVTRPDASVVTGDGTETPGSDTVVTNVDGNFAYSYMIDGIQAEGTYTVEAIDTAPDPDYLLAATSFIDTAQFLLQGCSWHKGDCTQEAPPAWADGMTPMDGWTSGVLKGWFELEDVPYRLRVNLPKPGDAGTYYITNEHDNLRSGVQGADDVTEFYIGKYSDGTLIKTCNFQPTRVVGDNPTTLNPCIVTGDNTTLLGVDPDHTYTGVDDDGDGYSAEDPTDGVNNDPGNDTYVDEDPSGSYIPARRIQNTWAILFEASEAGGSDKKWALYWKAHLALGSSSFPGASLHANTTATGSQDVPIKNIQPPPTICGNGIIEGSEQCDDGNNISGDGCSAACIIEFCGDGILQAGLGEQCDDGNNINGDGCSAACLLEPPPPPPIDLYINKSYTGTPNPGKTLSFILEYGNTGAGNASSVVVTDDYDQDYIIPGNICCGGIDDGNKITWSIGSVTGWSGPFALTYDGKIHDGTPDTNSHMPIGDTHVVNSATITTTSTDVDPSDNIWVVDILVHAEPDLFVTKTVNSGPLAEVKIGDTVLITLTYGNSDNNDAPNVTLCDDYNQTYLAPIFATITAGGVDDGDKICWGLTPDSLPGVILGTRTLPGIDPIAGYQAAVIDNPVDWLDPAAITTSDPEPLIKLLNNSSTVQFVLEQPTAIRLSSFNAIYAGEEVLISWRTGSEIDTEGFSILRSASPGGPYIRITPSMIVSTGSPFAGGRYSFVDTAVEDGKSYYYKLEEVDNKGNMAQYGPVAAVAEITPTRGIRSHQEEGGKEEVAAGPGYQSEGLVMRPRAAPTPVYTIMAYADSPAKFLSGEVVDEETVQGIRSRVLKGQGQESPPPAPSSAINPRPNPPPQGGRISEKEVWGTPADDAASPPSIRFRIIDAEGNEVAVASLASSSPTLTLSHKGEGMKNAGEGKGIAEGGSNLALQTERKADLVILTWYATNAVKGFHILRSATKDGPYQQITKTPIPYIGTGIEGVTDQIFRFTYTDRNVKKDKDYYYRLETISIEEDKTVSR